MESAELHQFCAKSQILAIYVMYSIGIGSNEIGNTGANLLSSAIVKMKLLKNLRKRYDQSYKIIILAQ